MNEVSEVNLEPADGSIPQFLDRRNQGDAKEGVAVGQEATKEESNETGV